MNFNVRWVNVPATLVAMIMTTAPAPLTFAAETAHPQVSSSRLSDAVSQSGWQPLNSPSGRFTVQVPGLPQQETASTPLLNTSLNWTIHKVGNGIERYAIAYTDLSIEALQVGRTALLDSLKQRLLTQDFDWTAVTNRGRRIHLGEVPGVEFLDLRHGKISTLRLFLVKRRLYALLATSNDLARVNRFVSSFTVAPLWQPFVSKTGRFTVNLPMAPIVTAESTSYQGQSINWKKFDGKNVYAKEDSYVVAYTDLSAQLLKAGQEAALNSAAQTTLTALGVSGLSEHGRAIALGTHPGREFMTTTKTGTSVVLRFYLVGERLYGVFASTKSLSNLDQFLSSFDVN